MVSLKLQKRLAASVLGCGKHRVWLDPNENSAISLANSRQDVRRLYRNGLIIKKPVRMHSRYTWRRMRISRMRGRHRGLGCRKGTASARLDPKVAWMQRIRILRRLLKKFRDQKKIDHHVYRQFYLKAKGGVYKNKRLLIEAIYKDKTESLRIKALEEQASTLKKRRSGTTTTTVAKVDPSTNTLSQPQ